MLRSSVPKQLQRGSLRTFSEADIIDSLGTIYVQRGRNYWRQGAILDLRSNSDYSRMSARVQGSKRQPYVVEIALEWSGSQWTIDGECSCPMFFNCKHVAAVLLSVVNGRQAETEHSLSPKLTRWLEDLALALKPPHVVTSNSGVQTLLYLIRISDWRDRPEPQIALCITKRLKSGAYAAGREQADFEAEKKH